MSDNFYLTEILNGKSLEELPLDFIGTKYFSDIYVFKSVLGSGSFSVVLKVLERSTNMEFAFKVRLFKKIRSYQRIP